jgi:hypothetical protein
MVYGRDAVEMNFQSKGMLQQTHGDVVRDEDETASAT